MSDPQLTVGQTIADLRVAAGLSVDDVAESTRIRATLIRGIEVDDFSLCGGDVYTRGHLKSIARVLGTDAVGLIAIFDEQQGVKQVAPQPVEPLASPNAVLAAASGSGLSALAQTLGTKRERGRRGTNWTAVMAVVGVLIAGVALFSFITNRSAPQVIASGVTPTPTPSASVQPSLSATPSPSPAQTSLEPSTSPSDAIANAHGVSVILTVTGNAAWIRATEGKGGRTIYEGTLASGKNKTFTADRSVALIIGDAGAVSLNVNGTELGAPGGNGQVVKLEFGPGNPTAQAG
ncbi:MAG: RodZ domain-containing protein [Actinomycetes bacterium]